MRTQIDHWLTDDAGSDPDFPMLYRYLEQEGLVATLKSWQLRLNTWAKMVDPRERKEWRTADLVGDALRAVHPFTQADLEAEFDRLLRRSARMASFTDDRPPESPDSAQWLLHRGWARSGMWDRYGGRHEGACLVFSSPDLLPEVEAAIPLGSGSLRSWGRVRYVDAPISLALPAAAASDVTSAEHLREVLDHATGMRNVARDLYGTKLSDWASEREYRIIEVLWDPPPSVDLASPLGVPIGSSLKAVILGEECPAAPIRDLLDGLPAGLDKPDVLRCVWEGGVPFLNLV